MKDEGEKDDGMLFMKRQRIKDSSVLLSVPKASFLPLFPQLFLLVCLDISIIKTSALLRNYLINVNVLTVDIGAFKATQTDRYLHLITF